MTERDPDVPNEAQDHEPVRAPQGDDAPPRRESRPFVVLGLILGGALLIAILLIVVAVGYLV